MVRLIHPKLKIWEEDDEIKTVAVTAVGDKAFCAGGDIRALYDWGKSNDKKATGFYYEEYQLNQLIKSYTKPYASFVNGIVMGGGVGVSVHGSFTEWLEKITHLRCQKLVLVYFQMLEEVFFYLD